VALNGVNAEQVSYSVKRHKYNKGDREIDDEREPTIADITLYSFVDGVHYKAEYRPKDKYD
jgi:hypothetical protein